MFAAVFHDVFRLDERVKIATALDEVLRWPAFARSGVYAFWDPSDALPVLYVGVASRERKSTAAYRFRAHTGVGKTDAELAHIRAGTAKVPGCKLKQVVDYFAAGKPLLGYSFMVQSAKAENVARGDTYRKTRLHSLRTEGALIEGHLIGFRSRPEWNDANSSIEGQAVARKLTQRDWYEQYSILVAVHPLARSGLPLRAYIDPAAKDPRDFMRLESALHVARARAEHDPNRDPSQPDRQRFLDALAGLAAGDHELVQLLEMGINVGYGPLKGVRYDDVLPLFR